MLCECVCMFIAHSHRNYGIDLAVHYRSYHVIISTFDPEKKNAGSHGVCKNLKFTRAVVNSSSSCQFYEKKRKKEKFFIWSDSQSNTIFYYLLW